MVSLKTKKRSAIKNTSKLAASNFAKKILTCIYGDIEIPYPLVSFKTTPGVSPLLKKIAVTYLVKVNKIDLPIVTSIVLQLEKHAKVWMLNGPAEITLKRGQIDYLLFFVSDDGITFRPFSKGQQDVLAHFQKNVL